MEAAPLLRVPACANGDHVLGLVGGTGPTLASAVLIGVARNVLGPPKTVTVGKRLGKNSKSGVLPGEIGVIGGRGGIRTHGTLAGTPVFKTGALNHSATLPLQPFNHLANRISRIVLPRARFAVPAT